jgi:hypothetical protein
MKEASLLAGLREPNFRLHLRPAHGETELTSWPAEVTFGDKFNQCMEQVKLPVGLRSLTFGYDFSQSTEKGSLQCITFDYKFNQFMEAVCLPAGL